MKSRQSSHPLRHLHPVYAYRPGFGDLTVANILLNQQSIDTNLSDN